MSYYDIFYRLGVAQQRDMTDGRTDRCHF